ncbi:MAG: ATP-grasp domain-containing protein [Rhizobiales bacterium]|nr:ATP-grasp domain-containing protein [Hyphomicrobiales bacterium]
MTDEPSALAPIPRVLLFAIQTSHAGSCRLPKLFREAGFRVGILGLRSSLLQTTRHADERFVLSARRFEPRIRSSLERAFAAFRPDIIVPCDERAVSVVNYWVGSGAGTAALTPSLRACLAHSLGSLERLPERNSKPRVLELARSVGIPTPREVKVTNSAECRRAAEAFGYPVVLKLSHGAGGNGVRLCATRGDLDDAFRIFERGQSSAKLWRRRILKRDWFGSRFDIVVQEFIAGRPAMSCVAAFSGRALSVVTAFADQVSESMGPATIARIVDIPAARRITESMVEAFGASGFLSFDFIVDEAGRAVLLECNPRPTQIMHLGHLVGVDLARSMREALAGVADIPREYPRGERQVALFPQEWTRHPASPVIAAAFHDVPWEDPELLRAILSKRPITWRGRHIP